jgi:hypothetical protein
VTTQEVYALVQKLGSCTAFNTNEDSSPASAPATTTDTAIDIPQFESELDDETVAYQLQLMLCGQLAFSIKTPTHLGGQS